MKKKLKFVFSFVLIRFRKSFDLLYAPEQFFVSSLDALTANSDSMAFS